MTLPAHGRQSREARMGSLLAAITWTLIVCLPMPLAGAAQDEARTELPPLPPGNNRMLLLEVFMDPGCPDCETFKNRILPPIRERFTSGMHLQWHDVTVMDHYLRLVTYQERLGVEGNPSVYVVLDGEESFSGLRAIAEDLPGRMEARLHARHGVPLPLASSESDDDNKDAAWSMMQRRYQAFTLGGVILAGLIDGINPCAISALVFLISMLSVSGLRGHRLLLFGILFIAATYITYFMLGLGAFRAMRMVLHGAEARRRWFEGVMIGLLAIFAFCSFRDAWRYHRTHDPSAVSLQLPGRLKTMMRKIVRSSLGRFSLVPAVILIAVAVTLIESVCTGQVYVPTLAWLLREGKVGFGAILYLALYNLMHVAPLILAFILVSKGMRANALVDWSRRNVVPAKCSLGFFFLTMMVLFWIV